MDSSRSLLRPSRSNKWKVPLSGPATLEEIAETWISTLHIHFFQAQQLSLDL